MAKDGKVWQKVVKCCKVRNYSNFKNSLTYKPICSNFISNMGQSGSNQAEMGQSGPKCGKVGSKWFEVVRSGLKWFEVV